MLLLLACIFAGGIHFSDAVVFDSQQGALREHVDILVNDAGTVEMVAYKPIPSREGYEKIEQALILPPLTDFYSLVQDRGLGVDLDIDEKAQKHMAQYLLRLGFEAVRDPVFPTDALFEVWHPNQKVFAQAGYLELQGGPAAAFSLVVDPEKSVEDAASFFPAEGPVTLWWAPGGGRTEIRWPRHPEFLHALIETAHAQNRKIGAWVQDASAQDMAAFFSFPFDYFVGLPAAMPEIDDTVRADLVWVPLAGLNDKRYCAGFLAERLPELRKNGLFDSLKLARTQQRLDMIRGAVAERCGVWKRRRDSALKPVTDWVEGGGRLGLGSGGGHQFAFSGDIAGELQVLEYLDVPQSVLLAAVFKENRELLGLPKVTLAPGKPAHFLVWFEEALWTKRIGQAPDLIFFNGARVKAPDALLE